jgi:hypothetical protein
MRKNAWASSLVKSGRMVTPAENAVTPTSVQAKKPYSRRCTRCKHEESATAHTIFHGCHLPISEAMEIAYTVCGDPNVSSYELSRKLERRQMTCWKFKKKILECIETRGELKLVPND